MCAKEKYRTPSTAERGLASALEPRGQMEYLQFEPLLLDRLLLCGRAHDETPSHTKWLRALRANRFNGSQFMIFELRENVHIGFWWRLRGDSV